MSTSSNDRRIDCMVAVIVAILAFVFWVQDLVQAVLLPQHGGQAPGCHPNLVGRTHCCQILACHAGQVGRVGQVPVKKVLFPEEIFESALLEPLCLVPGQA